MILWRISTAAIFKNFLIVINKLLVMLRNMISNDVKEIAFGAILALGVKLLGIACIFLMNLVIVRQLGASEVTYL